ncbi:MAG: hypothetical protein WKG07_33225 [Hymenobacter sp.]
MNFKTTYGHDPNEWDFGQWNFKTAFKNDFKQWGAYGFELRSQLSNFSNWTVADQSRDARPRHEVRNGVRGRAGSYWSVSFQLFRE